MDRANTYVLSQQEETKIYEAFNMYDNECSGFIHESNLKFAMKAVGFEESAEAINRQIEEYAEDGRIPFFVFRLIMRKKFAECQPRAMALESFRYFDNGGTGKITFDSLKRVARELGKPLSDEELQEMINDADLDHDGAIGQDDYMQLMQ